MSGFEELLAKSDWKGAKALAESGALTPKDLDAAVEMKRKSLVKAMLKAGTQATPTVMWLMSEYMRDGKLVPGLVAAGADLNVV